MKVLIAISTLLAISSAAPQYLRSGLVGGVVSGVVGVGAGQTSHQSVLKPLQGENRGVVQSKAFGAGVAAVSDHPSVLHGAHSNRIGGVISTGLSHGVIGGGGLIGGLGHGVVGGHGLIGGVSHGVVGGHGLVGGLGHGVVGGHGLVGGLGHGVVGGHGFIGGVSQGVIGGHSVIGGIGSGADIYPDEISPYTYQYNVADDYSGSNFQAAESDDGTSNRDGHYSVALPDGRIQHVNYHANDLDGYVAEVTYEGTAAFPEVVRGVSGVRPVGVVGGAALVSRPVVSGIGSLGVVSGNRAIIG